MKNVSTHYDVGWFDSFVIVFQSHKNKKGGFAKVIICTNSNIHCSLPFGCFLFCLVMFEVIGTSETILTWEMEAKTRLEEEEWSESNLSFLISWTSWRTGTGEAMIVVAPNIRLHHPASISPSCQGPLPNVTVELGMRNLTTLSHLFEHLALSW